jgi:hypothetical protein
VIDVVIPADNSSFRFLGPDVNELSPGGNNLYLNSEGAWSIAFDSGYSSTPLNKVFLNLYLGTPTQGQFICRVVYAGPFD